MCVRIPRISDPAKLRALLGAVLLTVSDLDLDAVLRSLVEEGVSELMYQGKQTHGGTR